MSSADNTTHLTPVRSQINQARHRRPSGSERRRRDRHEELHGQSAPQARSGMGSRSLRNYAAEALIPRPLSGLSRKIRDR